MGSFDRIWAPWRLDYVQATEKNRESEQQTPIEFMPGADHKCFICQAVADRSPDSDQTRYVIGHTNQTIAILNRYPYNNGHLLITPREHLARLDQIQPETHAEIIKQMNHWIGIYEKLLNPDGFNVGLNLGSAAGAGLPGHLHWHIVPRWNGDTNFMPALTGTKVIPQSLEALWGLLVDYTDS